MGWSMLTIIAFFLEMLIADYTVWIAFHPSIIFVQSSLLENIEIIVLEILFFRFTLKWQKLFIYPWKLQNLCHRSFAETAKYLIKIADKGHWIVIILGARYSKLFSIATIGHMGLFPCCIIFHCLYDTLETYKGHFRRRNAIFFKEKRKNLCCHQMVQSFCWPIFQSLKGCYNSKSNEQFRQPFLVSFQLIIILNGVILFSIFRHLFYGTY